MTARKHPLIRTLGFALSLGLFAIVWMNRPENEYLDLLPFPTWNEATSYHYPLQRTEDIDTLMSAYANFGPTSDTLISTAQADTEKKILSASNESSSFQVALKETKRPESNARTKPHILLSESVTSSLHPNLQLQGSEIAFSRLKNLFNRLENPTQNGPLHIFHFGDSQIEGDRITRTLRSVWQKRWGGYGIGYLSPLPLVAPLSFTLNASPGWVRHARFGRRDTTIKHERFGILASFASHETENDSGDIPWIRLQTTRSANDRERQIHSLQILFGKTESNTSLSCYVDTGFIGTYSIPADSITSELTIPITQTNASIAFHSIELKFNESVPEIDAIGIFPDTGLVFHNVAMRGSSGTLFRQLDRNQFSNQIQSHEMGMVILQFGGNAVPYISDELAVQRYASWFSSQIKLFQSLIPNVAIIVIGPSDMAVKQGQNMVTYPMLIPVRNALLQATIEQNALYWDVFKVMGGEGSMAAWANAETKLASSDHVHFTRKGAEKIASLLAQSLDSEWVAWKSQSSSSQNTIDNPAP